jgi:hypothetical protein
MKPDPIQPTNPQRQHRPLTLEPSKLALDRAARAAQLPTPLRCPRDQGVQAVGLDPHGRRLALARKSAPAKVHSPRSQAGVRTARLAGCSSAASLGCSPGRSAGCTAPAASLSERTRLRATCTASSSRSARGSTSSGPTPARSSSTRRRRRLGAPEKPLGPATREAPERPADVDAEAVKRLIDQTRRRRPRRR